jgi:hypothetical protein
MTNEPQRHRGHRKENTENGQKQEKKEVIWFLASI